MSFISVLRFLLFTLLNSGLYAVSPWSKKHTFCSHPAPALFLNEKENYWLHINLLVLRPSNTQQALGEVLNLLSEDKNGNGFWHHSIDIKE